MLKLNLFPVRSDDHQATVNWQDSVLAVDGTPYDLSLLGDGDTADHPVLGKVTRTGNNYECTIRITHGANAPVETRFPTPITLETDGDVTLPPYDEQKENTDELA